MLKKVQFADVYLEWTINKTGKIAGLYKQVTSPRFYIYCMSCFHNYRLALPQ